MPSALLIGNSDGIGLALTRRLLEDGYRVAGISRSRSPVDHENYWHYVGDVRSDEFRETLEEACDVLEAVDVCVYCAGIGEELDLEEFAIEREVFEVNLMGAVIAVEVVLPLMLAAGSGHFIGLSSQADRFNNPNAPSYSASKAGMSSYLEALAVAVRPRGVHITNVRFGFVATKMAKSDVKPFEISADRAAALVMRCVKRRPIRFTYPKRMAALLWLIAWPGRIRLWLT